jgi:hypothetical protein
VVERSCKVEYIWARGDGEVPSWEKNIQELVIKDI